MKKLNIKLNSRFKSFGEGFETKLEGDLIILSGINGSGKSQLLNIASQKEIDNLTPNSVLDLSGQPLNCKRDILFRSFKDRLTAQDFTTYSPQTSAQHLNQFKNSYKKNRFNLTSQENQNLQECIARAHDRLIQAGHTNEEITAGGISEVELDKALLGLEFIADNHFTKQIAGSFYKFAKEAHWKEHKNEAVDYTNAPWNRLNEILDSLKVGYKVADEYSLSEDDGFTLSPQIQLRSTTDQSPRALNDLSDGEKAIVGLAFDAMEHPEISVLLLDEYDATFNPSLTDAFFEVLEKYYTNSDVMVILASHSIATISMAPMQTCFYEVFKKEDHEGRVLAVLGAESYKEVGLANKKLYAEITQQKERVEKLETDIENKVHELELANSSSSKKYQLYVEGETDKKYIERAAQIFHFDLTDYKIIDVGGDGEVAKKYKILSKTEQDELEKDHYYFLLDSDARGDDDASRGKCTKKRILQENHPIKKGIENLFPTSLITKARGHENGKFFKIESTQTFDRGCVPTTSEKITVADSEKNNLCDWIIANGDESDLEELKQIMDFIKAPRVTSD